MGATYSYLDKELTNKYKNKVIIINKPIFISTNPCKSTLDINSIWARYPGVYGKKYPYTIYIIRDKDPLNIFNTLKTTTPLILTIKRIEYVTIYTGPDECRDDREYDIFAQDQYNNTYEISNLFKDVNTCVKPDVIITTPHIKPKFQKFMTGSENNFKYAMFPIDLECKSGISFKK